MYDFQDKIAVVSGAAKGIGKACALRMAKEKCRLMLLDLPAKDGSVPKELQETVDEIKKLGCEVQVSLTDISNKADIENSVKVVMNHYGRIDFLINVAGIGLMNTLEGISEEEWDRTVDVDMKGVFLIAQATAEIFRKQKWGKIVNMASIAGVTGGDNLFPYNAAKAGVINFTQSLARNLGPYGINVNSVCPGFIWTPMWMVTDRWIFEFSFPGEDYVPKRVYNNAVASTCLQRPTTPEHVANVVAWLCSEEASEVTGQHINVDGGAEFH